MVRAVCATLVCCIMIINLNYFQPHRNLIVFWVEQLANLSATIKYLFAVVIAAGGAVDANDGLNHVNPEDSRLMGYLLIVSDVGCFVISGFAILACVLLLHRNIVNAMGNELAENLFTHDAIAKRVTGGNSSMHNAIKKQLKKNYIVPQAHRRKSLRLEDHSDKGLSAMLNHANDHKKKTKKTKMFNAKPLQRVVSHVFKVKKVKETMQDHDMSLKRAQKQLATRSKDSYLRLQKRLQRRRLNLQINRFMLKSTH